MRAASGRTHNQIDSATLIYRTKEGLLEAGAGLLPQHVSRATSRSAHTLKTGRSAIARRRTLYRGPGQAGPRFAFSSSCSTHIKARGSARFLMRHLAIWRIDAGLKELIAEVVPREQPHVESVQEVRLVSPTAQRYPQVRTSGAAACLPEACSSFCGVIDLPRSADMPLLCNDSKCGRSTQGSPSSERRCAPG